MSIVSGHIKAKMGGIGAFIAGCVVVWVFGDSWFVEQDPLLFSWIQAILVLLLLAVASISLFKIGLAYKFATMAGKGWSLLAVGMASWFVGEFIYVYMELILEIDPFPTFADAFYLAGYIPLAAGLVIHAGLIKLPMSVGSKVLAATGTALIGTFIIVAVIVYPMSLSWPIPDEDVFVWFVGSLYPILDVMLVASVLIVTMKLRKGKISVAWVLLLVGLLFTVVADTLFNWVSNVGSDARLFEYYDLLFIISYTLVFASTIHVRELMRKAF